MKAVLWREYGYIPTDKLSWDEFRFLVHFALERGEKTREEMDKGDRDAELQRIIRKNT